MTPISLLSLFQRSSKAFAAALRHDRKGSLYTRRYISVIACGQQLTSKGVIFPQSWPGNRIHNCGTAESGENAAGRDEMTGEPARGLICSPQQRRRLRCGKGAFQSGAQSKRGRYNDVS